MFSVASDFSQVNANSQWHLMANKQLDFFGTLNKFVAAFDSALEIVKRIEALEIAEEKKAAAKRAKEAMKAKSIVKEVKQKPGLVSQSSKGKLDLSGQRKKFADRKFVLIKSHRIVDCLCLSSHYQ